MLIERVTGIGWRADAALRAASGEARVVAPLSASIYVEAAGEILWLGPPDAAPHARAVQADLRAGDLAAVAGSPLRVRHGALVPWRPPPPPATAAAAAALARGAAGLDLGALGTPRGLGAWLVGAPLVFPLESAGARVGALARACAADQPAFAADTAATLLGLGDGLTPSGDDLVGAAFFARALLHAGTRDAAGWRRAAARVREHAARATHPISAALLGDLAGGEGWAPLHDLAAALVAGDAAGGHDAARRLTRLGHSSGWDLLTGFLVGAGRERVRLAP